MRRQQVTKCDVSKLQNATLVGYKSDAIRLQLGRQQVTKHDVSKLQNADISRLQKRRYQVTIGTLVGYKTRRQQVTKHDVSRLQNATFYLHKRRRFLSKHATKGEADGQAVMEWIGKAHRPGRHPKEQGTQVKTLGRGRCMSTQASFVLAQRLHPHTSRSSTLPEQNWRRNRTNHRHLKPLILYIYICNNIIVQFFFLHSILSVLGLALSILYELVQNFGNQGYVFSVSEFLTSVNSATVPDRTRGHGWLL